MGKPYQRAAFLDVALYTNVQRWPREINGRAAAQREQRVNRTGGDEDSQLAARHHASDLD